MVRLYHDKTVKIEKASYLRFLNINWIPVYNFFPFFLGNIDWHVIYSSLAQNAHRHQVVEVNMREFKKGIVLKGNVWTDEMQNANMFHHLRKWQRNGFKIPKKLSPSQKKNTF